MWLFNAFFCSELLFIAFTGGLLIYFFPFIYKDYFFFLLEVSTIVSLVTTLFWLLFTGANSFLSTDGD